MHQRASCNFHFAGDICTDRTRSQALFIQVLDLQLRNHAKEGTISHYLIS
ncbi:hypothetical protein Peur_046731 [Populus x canadensis]